MGIDTSKLQPLFTARGRVIGGSSIAHVLGFPTANIYLTDPKLSGTYAGVVRIENQTYPAAVYADPKRLLLESHLLDFNADLYGKEIVVELFEKVAPVEAYTGDESAREHIARAVQNVRDYFEKN